MYKCSASDNIALLFQKSLLFGLIIKTLMLTILWVCVNQAALAQEVDDEFTVLIDPGHGGKDSGTRGGGYFEKKVVLEVSLEVAEQLKSTPDIKGVLTRDKDVFIPLDERARIGNKVNADLFISIHCNAAADTRAYGAETFVLGLHRNEDNFEIAKKENKVILMEDDYEVKYDGFDPKSPESYMTFTVMQEEYLDESILLADKVQKRFTNHLSRHNRGVKQAGFLVLRETSMPSVLIELGFLSNPKEGKFLNSKQGQKKMANAIVKAIKAYKRSVRSSSVSEIKSQRIEVKENQDNVKENLYTFKVQIAASSKQIAASKDNFNGLEPISKGKEGNFYKYYYGKASDYQTAKRLVKSAKNKGYQTAFVVAFKPNGEKISVAKAIASNKD
jgi:N-acetylmuramoyl-L-alanine amidase